MVREGWYLTLPGISTSPTVLTSGSERIDTNGIINTVAGNGVASFAGDGGPATSAEIRGGQLAFDSFGNLFMVDSVNNVIRVLDDLAPTVTFGTPVPPPNAHGWNNGSVIVPFDANDTGRRCSVHQSDQPAGSGG